MEKERLLPSIAYFVLEGRKEGRWGDLVVLYYFAFSFCLFLPFFGLEWVNLFGRGLGF
jgi:hypothetical protein